MTGTENKVNAILKGLNKMSNSPCPSFDPAMLLSHLTGCLICRSDRQRLLDFAVEILDGASGETASDRGSSNILLVNHHVPAGPVPDPAQVSPIFRDFVKTRFEPDVTRQLKPCGRTGYEFILRRYVVPVIGELRLSEITFEMIQEGVVQKMLDAGYAVSTVKRARDVTTAVFKHAMLTRQFAGVMPSFRVRLPQMKRKKPKRALTMTQARDVLEMLRSPYRAMALVSMTTSMNLAEMCALRWKRINLSAEPVLSDGEIIPAYSATVRENFCLGQFGAPKTASRRRCVALPMATVAELESLKRTTRFPGPDDIVFATYRGTPKHASNLHNQVIKPVGRRLGIPWLHWHCLRYTFATLGEQLGMALSDRRAQMGHGEVEVTMEYTVSDIARRRVGSEMIARRIA